MADGPPAPAPLRCRGRSPQRADSGGDIYMTGMRRIGAVLSVLSVRVVVAGCAPSTEWDTGKSHRAHFASGDHAVFSLRNSDTAVRVGRADLEPARPESWWGKPLTVDQAQIPER